MAIPTLAVEVDFQANPTAKYADVHTTADGIVSFWRCNATGTFNDELGVNNGTQISTGSTTAGPYSYDSDLALTYDGANDSSYVPSSASLTLNTAFSVDGWFKVASLPGATRDLVAKRGSWLLQLNSSGKLLWTMKDDTSTATITSGTTVATNTYYHVTGVYDDANILLYVNGVLDGSTAYSSGAELGAQPIRFAATPWTTAPTWQSSTTASGNSTSATGTAPASISAGDLLIAQIACHSATTAPSVTAVPTDWVLIEAQPTTENSFSNLYYKIATGSEPANYTWTISPSVNWNAPITRITGQDTVAFLANICYGDVFNTNTVNKTTGAHIANMANTLRLDFVYSRGATLTTFSSGTERYDYQAGNATAMASQVPSESSLAQTVTSGNSEGLAHTLHIAGTGLDEVACTLDDWAFWNKGLSADEIARNYASRNGGQGTWTAVSSSTRSITIVGANRQYELDRMVAGTAAFPLKDPSKNFDPGNTSGSNYPNVVPMRRIRAQCTHNSTTYDLCKNYVDRWPPRSLGNNLQEVDVSSTDGFDLLALATVEGELEVSLSGSQIDVILDKALWPVADRAIDAGQYVMFSQTISEGTSALSLIQDIADSERGIFFIDRNGFATFHDAAHRGSQTRSTTSQATFTDHNSVSGIVYQSLEPSFDKDRITNDWTVTPASGVVGGAAQRVIDAPSAAKYGLRSQSRSTLLGTNADAESQARNLLNETASPMLRFESLSVTTETTASVDTLLGLRVSDRVTVKRGFGPNWNGATLTRDYFVEGKTITATPGVPWTFTLQLSPVSSGDYYMTVMRDEPVSYWRLDSLT